MRRQTDGIQKIHGAVGADSGGRAHGTGEHQRDGGIHCELEKIGGFFHGIGAMDDDKPILFTGQCIHPF